MLTTMVAGHGPAYCENSGRNHQVLDVAPPPNGHQYNSISIVGSTLRPPSPNSIFVPSSVVTTTSSISNSLNSSVTTTSPSTSRPNSCVNGTGGMVTVVQNDICSGVPQQQYTPPPLSQPQGPPPPYCSQEYVSENIYYSGPPDYSPHHSMCAIHHGVGGPATVRMVSTNSSPPIPLPVQMPPGHVVQQIVDETGTLQHVILSAQPMPLPVCSYCCQCHEDAQLDSQFMEAGDFGAEANLCSFGYHRLRPNGPNTGQGPPQYYRSPPPGPPPPQGYMAYNQPPQYSPVMSPPLTQASPPPHNYQKNDRNSRQHDKIRKFYQQRHQPMQQHHHYQPQAPPIQLKSCGSNIHCSSQLSPKKDNSLHYKIEGMTNGESSEEPQISLQNLLSFNKLPEVSNIEPYSATVHWDPPDLSAYPQKEISVSSLRYEVFLNKNIYDTVSTTHLVLANLRPATEYKLNFVCMCDGIRGNPSPLKSFCTKPTIPDPPQPPRLYDRKKQSLTFKWNVPKDNGSRIIHYNLEICGGQYARWTEVYRNRNREFSVHKLQPQTTYRFRLSACNDIGDSDYSPETIATTLGLAPTQPNHPTLDESSINSLSLSWAKRSSDEEFSLEMEDSVNDYGFRPVFCGSETSYTCHNLRRNADYKFRLCCQNVNGKSPFSEIICYRTLPDKPQPPSVPSLKGKSHPDKLSICWKPPSDHGGTPVTSYIAEMDKGNGFEVIYTGSSLECEASSLSPGTSYKTRVAAISAGGKSKWSEIGIVTTSPVTPGPCKPPRLVGKPKANTLQLKWAQPAFDGGSLILEYQVEMMTSNSERRQVYCGRDLDCTVASLLPGRPYMFVLRAANRVGPGLWSEPVEVVSGAGPPDAPRAPLLACKGPHTVFVSWEEPINNGAGVELYSVHMAEVSSPNTESSESSSTCGEPECELTFTKVYTGSVPSAEVRNLTPANTYAFRVSASNSAGAGSFSAYATVTTPAAPPASVAHITSTAEAMDIMLHWTEPACHGDPITHYNVEIGDKIIETPGPVLEFLVTDLLPETAYKIRIQAVNTVGVSPFSTAHRVTTQPLPPTPPLVELVKASFNSLRLKWGDGKNPDLLKYSLQMELLNPHNNSMEFYQVYRGTNQTFKVGKLEENTTYKLRICATNEAGVGPYSEPVEFTTTKAPPPPLKAPRIAEGPDGTYCVEWCGVRCPGEDRIIYRLQVLQAGKDQDYSLVFTGSETSFILTDLEQQTGYYLRVCGVRMSGDKEVVAGAYSSPILFNTPKVEVVESITSSTSTSQKTSFEWRLMTDHQKALAILIMFSFLAFVAAYVLSPDSGR